MIHKVAFIGLLRLAFFLALAPALLASNTSYLDGVNGNDHNDCESRQKPLPTPRPSAMPVGAAKTAPKPS